MIHRRAACSVKRRGIIWRLHTRDHINADLLHRRRHTLKCAHPLGFERGAGKAGKPPCHVAHAEARHNTSHAVPAGTESHLTQWRVNHDGVLQLITWHPGVGCLAHARRGHDDMATQHTQTTSNRRYAATLEAHTDGDKQHSK